MDVHAHWPELRALFRDAFRSSFHFSIATVDEHGEPHVAPIGSLVLTTPGRGFYFERFPQRLPRNLQAHGRVCVLAVNSSRWYWIRSLVRGRFADPPAVRLYGTAGELRPATPAEIERWQRRVRRARFTKGHRKMWRGMDSVRDIEFDRIEPVRLGEMTRAHWAAPAAE